PKPTKAMPTPANPTQAKPSQAKPSPNRAAAARPSDALRSRDQPPPADRRMFTSGDKSTQI
ncbi:hypothetical protein K6W58_23710, partial [Burkholderia cepacia]|uniref:hypothetical protein n=1 Tax=Burkholderia cepacia TaxID=292 RepID=UPI001C95C6C9